MRKTDLIILPKTFSSHAKEISLQTETPVRQKLYCVIGNFSTEYNPRLDEVFNVHSGLSKQAFLANFEHFAKERGLSVEHTSEDSIVIKGNEADYAELRRLNGQLFSYAHTDGVGLGYMLDAEQDYAKNPPPLETQGERLTHLLHA